MTLISAILLIFLRHRSHGKQPTELKVNIFDEEILSNDKVEKTVALTSYFSGDLQELNEKMQLDDGKDF